DSVEGLTGAWHFINMTPSLSNDFDDRQGLYYLEAGVNREPGTVDLAILIASTYTGLSVHYDTSNGPARYQVEAASDGHENTDPMRGKAQWQAYPLGLTVFEPVDNLGFFGWHKFHDEKQAATFLAWPLHALGDATVPMHVTGTTAWGHRPFENAQERLWPLIGRRMGINTIAPGTASVNAIGSSDPELANVLARAVAWRQQVLQWRSKGHGKDVPVRDLITNLAQRTYNYSMTRQDELGDWPFRDWPSTEYFLGAKETAEAFYREYPDAVTKVLPLMEDGVAAKTAFLLSAMEEVQP
ncbi:MAG TPA: hypothetical protein VE775_02980, partial [Pyrinomonadaceae bacterium]|nr:hypothetical protein [Pyrinomonadaceae bacterium]